MPRASRNTQEEVVVDPVALACGRFETFAIDDRQAAVVVSNEPGALQLAGGFGHAGAPDAQHRGEKLMGHWHDIVLQPVMRHQQPTRASLLDRVEPIARRGLRAEIEQSVDEPHHDGADSRALIEGCLAFGGVHPQRATGNLHKSLLARCFPAEKEGRSNSALDPDHPDFDRSGIRHSGQDRDDPFFDEIDMRERRARHIEHLFLS